MMKLSVVTAASMTNGSGVHWAAIALAAFAGLQVLVLILAAKYAAGQLQEARDARRDQTRPYVVASFELSQAARTLVEIVIENIGKTPAHDINVSFSPAMESTMAAPDGDRMNDWSAIKNGISFLAPGQRMTHLFDNLIARYADDCKLPRRHQVTVTYRGRKATDSYAETHTIDLGVWYGSHFTTVYGIHDIAKSLEKVAKTLERWTNWDGVKAYGVDLERYEEARAARARRAVGGSEGVPSENGMSDVAESAEDAVDRSESDT
jgi:hypothetical protein